jgi:hypothetical protein
VLEPVTLVESIVCILAEISLIYICNRIIEPVKNKRGCPSFEKASFKKNEGIALKAFFEASVKNREFLSFGFLSLSFHLPDIEHTYEINYIEAVLSRYYLKNILLAAKLRGINP